MCVALECAPVLAEIYFLRAEALLRMRAQEEASARVVPITLPAARHVDDTLVSAPRVREQPAFA